MNKDEYKLRLKKTNNIEWMPVTDNGISAGINMISVPVY